MKPYILLLTIATGTLCATAQDLHTEITVDRTVQPDIREATRPTGAMPSILQPEVRLKKLNQAEYSNPGTLTQEISILPAAAWADSIEHAPYRGYASIGYLPLYNLGANVGYRFFDNPKFGLGLWAQYNGESYNGDIPYFEDALFTTHNFNIGGNASLKCGSNSLLTARGSIALKSIRQPYFFNVHGDEFRRSYNQGIKDMRAEARWNSRIGEAVYGIKGALGYFEMGHDIPDEISNYSESVRQALVEIGGNVGAADEKGIPWIGVDADFKIIRSTNIPEIVNDYYLTYTYGNRWLAAAKPYLRFENDMVQGLIGANITVGHGFNGKTRIAPVAQVSFRPAAPFVMYAKVTGGQYFNMMRDVVEINPYINPTESYGVSNIPMAVSGGMNIGPYDGMSLCINGGFAMARDFLSPLITIQRNGHLISSYEYVDINTWYIGAELSYAYKQWFVLSGSVKCGGADREYNSWYEWTDGAKVISDISLKVTPTDPLEVHVTYNLRYDRKAKTIIYPYNTISSTVFVGIPNLGTVNSVNLGGSYKINDQITAFLEADNLLNQRHKLISGMPSAGIHGLLGIACKF